MAVSFIVESDWLPSGRQTSERIHTAYLTNRLRGCHWVNLEVDSWSAQGVADKMVGADRMLQTTDHQSSSLSMTGLVRMVSSTDLVDVTPRCSQQRDHKRDLMEVFQIESCICDYL